MDHKKTEAIILRTRNLSDSDLIVSFFSPGYGNIKGVAKGAKKSARRFVNSLNIFSLVDLEFKERRNSELLWVDSCELINGFPGIRSDYNMLQRASYAVELTEILFPSNVESPEMFTLLRSTLDALSSMRHPGKTMVIFQGRAMSTGGFGINLNKCALCGRKYQGKGRALFDALSGSIICTGCKKESSALPGMTPESVAILHKIQSCEPSRMDKIKIPDSTINELREVLNAHVEYRLGRRIKSGGYIRD